MTEETVITKHLEGRKGTWLTGETCRNYKCSEGLWLRFQAFCAAQDPNR